MKLSDFNFKVDNDGNILISGPQGFVNGIADNEQYLTNYNLAYILLFLKAKLSPEDWMEIISQIKEL